MYWLSSFSGGELYSLRLRILVHYDPIGDDIGNGFPWDHRMQSFIRTRLVMGLTVVSAIVCGLRLWADEAEKKDSPPPELISVIVPVTTEDDEPIEGAVVRPHGLRTLAERASHYGWDTKLHGPDEDLLTDADGKVEIKYPKYVTERLETGEISLMVDHENFKLFDEDFAVGRGMMRVKLARGCRYTLRAIDSSTKQVIVKNVYCEISGASRTNEWKRQDDGTLRSLAVAEDRDFLRVIYLPDDGPAMFSSPVFLGNHRELMLDRRLPDVPVEPGRQIRGMLDDTVPRPVKNGHVIMRSANEISGKGDSQLKWNDWAPIDAEGKFHFESVPRNSIVMIVAVCEGYLSAAALPEELAAAGIQGAEAEAFASTRAILPLVVRLNDDLNDWTLPMLPTASCRVTVMAPDGSPLSGADVMASPNQLLPGIGGNVIGSGYSSERRHKVSEEHQQPYWSWTKRDEMKTLGVLKDFNVAYVQKTDKNGIAVLHTLPGGQSQAHKESIYVEHPDYEMPTSKDDPFARSVKVELLAEETAELTVRMQPKGTETIGDR